MPPEIIQPSGLSSPLASPLTAAIRVVLVEPAGALNVGSVARVLKNMGLKQLVLVNPQCDPLGPEARQMAVHAVDLLESAQQVTTLAQALAGAQVAVATTGLDHTALNVTLEAPRPVLSWLVASQMQAALIFGREDRGLTKTELSYAQRWIRIPTSPDYGSLNLAQAVAICCYELAQIGQVAYLPSSPSGPAFAAPSLDCAPLDALEGYYQQLEAFLLQIGYLQPHTAASRMEKFRLLYGRAQMSAAEVALCRGILTQAQWAMRQAQGPKPGPEQGPEQGPEPEIK